MMTKRKYTKAQESPKGEFDLRLDAFETDIRVIALEYGLARAECLKRHSWPPYLNGNFLSSLENLWARHAAEMAELNPAAAKAYIKKHKE